MRATAPMPLVGKHGKATEPTGEMAESRKIAREYPFTTTVLQPSPVGEWFGPAIYDAANECVHGFLPTDTPPRAERTDLVELWDQCDCWKRSGKTFTMPDRGATHTAAAAPAPAAPEAPKVETPVETLPEPETPPAIEGPAPMVMDLSPFIAQVVGELDGEGERLRDELHKIAQVRAALTEDA